MAVDEQVLADMHARLTGQLVELATGDTWLGWLAQARQFHRYSAQNQMLLAMQGATGRVASYRTWQRIEAADGGRCQVAKGAKGLTILAPMTVTRRDTDEVTGDEIVVARGVRGFKAVKVFHEAQLVSPPAQAEVPLPKLLQGHNAHQHVWAAVRSRLEELGYHVDVVTHSPIDTWNGRTNFATGDVVVSDHLEPPARLKTLIHEWAHIALGHDARHLGRRDLQEVEAESVASLVCTTIGIDSAEYSVPYLAIWAGGDPQLLHDTAQTVLSATAEMIDTLEQELSIDLTPDLTANVEVTAPTSLFPTPERPRLTLVESPPTPLLDAATGVVATVMAGLVDETDRQQLLDGLDRIDDHLVTVASLCAAAGVDAATATTLLVEHGADPDAVYRALTEPVGDYLGEHPAEALFTNVAPPATRLTTREHGPRPAVMERLSSFDVELLDNTPLERPDQQASAARTLAAIGVTATEAVEILEHLGLDANTATATIALRHYDPASGQMTPLWPDPPTSLSPVTTAPDGPGPTPSGRVDLGEAMVTIVESVAATGDPGRLAGLADALGLEHREAITVWAAAHVEQPVAAAAAMQRRNGDVATTLDDLTAGWDAPVDWAAQLPADHTAPSTTISAAHAILQSWNTAATPPPPVRQLT